MREIKDNAKCGCRSAKVVKVIKVQTTKGTGTENDLYREVIQYWSLKGEFIAELDPLTENNDVEEVVKLIDGKTMYNTVMKGGK